MRDPKRIDDFCDRLKKIWREVPDWRFGQLMLNTLGEIGQRNKIDPFYIEDKEMIQTLEEMFGISNLSQEAGKDGKPIDTMSE